jgi:hypothetical protein
MRSEILKITVLFLIMGILLGVLSYSTESLAQTVYEDEEYYYLTFHTREDWQIWKIALDGSSEKIIYSIPNGGAFDEFPGLEFFDQNLVKQLQEQITEEPITRIFVSDVISEISPDANYIAIREMLVTFPEGKINGQSTIYIYDLRSTKEVYRYATLAEIYRLQWSNDMNYFTFQEYPFEANYSEHQIHVVDIQNQEEIFVTDGLFGTLSGNEAQYVMKVVPDNGVDYWTRKSCCKFLNLSDRHVEFRMLPSGINFNSFSLPSLSNSKQWLALVGFPKHEDITPNGILKIISSDNYRVRKNFPIEIEPGFEPEIQWSYDDQYIAYKYSENNFKVKVTELSTGFSTFVGYRISDYAWSESRNRLLYLKSDEDADACVQDDAEIFILDVTTNERTQLHIPAPLQRYMEENARSQECTEFITGVDW